MVRDHLVNNASAPRHRPTREMFEHSELNELIQDAYTVCSKSRGELVDQLCLKERFGSAVEDPRGYKEAQTAPIHELAKMLDSGVEIQ
jgi:hypothetical protein